jgi:Flp pilus assembly pilin Flp
MRCWRALLPDCSAATNIEYGLIAGLIAIGLLTSVSTLGKQLHNVFAVLASPSGPPPSNSGNNP